MTEFVLVTEEICNHVQKKILSYTLWDINKLKKVRIEILQTQDSDL